MDILCTDLDRTMIYSYKQNIGADKICVEKYEGRDVSFISGRTQELLCRITERVQLIPTTTRTQEQYERIDLGIGALEYALVCNGGILLNNGKRDGSWYEESLSLVEESRRMLERAIGLLRSEQRRYFDIRFIDELFVFTKCRESHRVVSALRDSLDQELVRVMSNGDKVYVVPVRLSKGMALRRLRKRLDPCFIAAAGDSEFDESLVQEADIGFVPAGFGSTFGVRTTSVLPDMLCEDPHTARIMQETCSVMEMTGAELFSEQLLRAYLQRIHMADLYDGYNMRSKRNDTYM